MRLIMDIQMFLLTNFLNGVIGILLLLTGYLVFDKLTPSIDFGEVFSTKGLTGASIIVAAFLIGLALVVSKATF